MGFLTGREDSLTATAISVLTPTEKLGPAYHRHLEQRAERSESTVLRGRGVP